MTNRRKFYVKAKCCFTFQSRLYRLSACPFYVFVLRFTRLGEIISTPHWRIRLSSAFESYALSPVNRADSLFMKHPARTASTGRHSAGEALATDMARGRPSPEAIATIMVPLPRLVGPTAKPFFALANVASMNASSRFSLPHWCKCRASRRKASTGLPWRTHC